MEKKSIINQLKDNIGIIITIIAFVSTIYALIVYYNKILMELELIEKHALRSTIHNHELHITERIDACTIYDGKGWDSWTAKECKRLMEEWMK